MHHLYGRRGPVVDAHHHLWARSRHPQRWIDPVTMAAIDADFLPADLEPLLRDAGVEQTIVVQSVPSEQETVDLLATAAREPLIGGVVGWVDLAAPDIAARLDRLRAADGGDQLVGIRHLVQDEPDPEFLDRFDIRRGIAAVGRAGLVFDLLVREHQLDAAVRLADDIQETAFVLDHLGKPALATRDIGAWARGLSRLAALPNVSSKLSGLVTEADWRTWAIGDLAPAVEYALDVFGPERTMFGSDWPVSLLATSYPSWIETVSELISDLDEDGRAAVWRGTARRSTG